MFATAKRRILLRAMMTAIVIALIFGAITMLIWQGAVDVAAGPHDRRHDRRLRALPAGSSRARSAR